MIRELDRTSFGDLERIDAAIATGTYRAPADAPSHEGGTKRAGKSRLR
jgi:hypothetical protein